VALSLLKPTKMFIVQMSRKFINPWPMRIESDVPSRRSSFVQVSSAEMNDDPFRRTPPSYLHKSPANRKEHRGSERVLKHSPRDTPTKSRSERTMTNWRNGSSTNSDTSPVYGNGSRLFDAQSSAGKGQVSKENAQSIYPPSSCVFVAK
jgi:hypothetical protein